MTGHNYIDCATVEKQKTLYFREGEESLLLLLSEYFVFTSICTFTYVQNVSASATSNGQTDRQAGRHDWKRLTCSRSLLS